MAYFKKVQRKVNGKWYPQGVPLSDKGSRKPLADLSALSLLVIVIRYWEISARYWAKL